MARSCCDRNYDRRECAAIQEYLVTLRLIAARDSDNCGSYPVYYGANIGDNAIN